MKYSSKRNKQTPQISTASLPDIVFMLLFFFMTVTTVKNTDLFIENELPSATEIAKIEKKDRVIELFVGKPKAALVSTHGDHPKIQIMNNLIPLSEVDNYVLEQVNKKPEHIRNLVTIALKIDKDVNVGMVSDIKEELRKVNALKINYITNDGDALLNLY